MRAAAAHHATAGDLLALLLRRLCDAGFAVSLETAGAHDIGVVDPRGAVAAGADCDHVDLGAEWHGSVGPVTFSA